MGLYWGNGKENGIYYLGFRVKCRPMINKPPPFKGLKKRVPIIIPIRGRGFINQGSTLSRDTAQRGPLSYPLKMSKPGLGL